MWHRHFCLCRVSPDSRDCKLSLQAASAGAQTKVSVPHRSLACGGRHSGVGVELPAARLTDRAEWCR